MHDSNASGMTLIETLVAITLLAVCLLGAVPLFVLASRANDTGGTIGTSGAIGLERLELLREVDYDALVPGGDLDTNVPGYFDDSHDGFVVRWTIEDRVAPAGTRQVTVRAMRADARAGARAIAEMTTVRAR